MPAPIIKSTVLVELSREIERYSRCSKDERFASAASDARNRADRLVKNYLPSGSGIDSGTRIDWDATRPNRIVFVFGFHHMDESGCYDGWTEHSAIITPDLVFGFSIRITGRDRNQVKDYLHECFDCALSEPATNYTESGIPEPVAD